MPVEKKKVNLVNLKAKFGLFLHNYYCCQNCYSIDKFAFGFTCEHKFCLPCNDNLTDQCKECKNEIENMVDDRLQKGLFPYFEDLKGIMSVDMTKVVNKLKQSNGQNIVQKPVEKEQVNVDKCEKQNIKNCEHRSIEKSVDPEPMEEENEKPEEEIKTSMNRSSKRQTAKKVNESKKNSSSTKQNKSVVTEAVQEKTTARSRESSRSKKNLNEYIKETIEEPREPEPKETEKTTAKSIRKADKSAKSAKKSLVIISTSITESELRILSKFAKKFNAKIVNDYSDEITHLVTLEAKPDSRLTTRTLKYLKSLLSHKWLLDFKWIKDSLESDKLVDESEYELLGITKQMDDQLGAPKRSRENQGINLFEGKNSTSMANLALNVVCRKMITKVSFEQSNKLIKVGGGELIELEKNIDDNTYIIIEATHMNKSKFKGDDHALSTTDFLNCVSDFKFDF